MAPILLPANQPADRFYKGGSQIRSFRSSETPSTDPNPDYQPEDWVASTTCCHGCRPIGMTTLPSGQLLADAVSSDPIQWLGEEHVRAFGTSTKILLKLLDAGQRLPVHAHPHDDWAKKHLGVDFGKAEAWYILTPGSVHLGLKEDVNSEELMELVNTQNMASLLPRMHRLDLTPGQTVYVPPGMLHAIGEGVLVVEIQEPSDLSILLEWKGFQIDGANLGHLGVGWEAALSAVDTKGWSDDQIRGLVVSEKGPSASVFASPSREYFAMERIVLAASEQSVTRGFAIVIVLGGSLELAASSHGSLQLQKGNTVVVPHGDGDFVLKGTGEVLIARPPLPK